MSKESVKKFVRGEDAWTQADEDRLHALKQEVEALEVTRASNLEPFAEKLGELLMSESAILSLTGCSAVVEILTSRAADVIELLEPFRTYPIN